MVLEHQRIIDADPRAPLNVRANGAHEDRSLLLGRGARFGDHAQIMHGLYTKIKNRKVLGL
jgi:hypothetical protein